MHLYDLQFGANLQMTTSFSRHAFSPAACREEPAIVTEAAAVLLYPKHLHHFIPKVIDDLHRDAAGLGFVERPGRVAMEG